MFNDPVCKWNEKKQHLFNPFNTLVLLEWLEKVTHVVFFETRLKDKKKKKRINKCSQGKLVHPACVWQHRLLIGVGYIQSSFASLPISWTNCPSCPGFGWFLKWEWVCEKFQDPKRRKKIRIKFLLKNNPFVSLNVIYWKDSSAMLLPEHTGWCERSWKECGVRTATAKKRRYTKLLTAEYWTCGSAVNGEHTW